MKALFIGLGSIGQRHLRNYIKLLNSNKDIIALRFTDSNNIIVDGKSVACENISKFYGINECFKLKDALDEKPDLGFVCNPSIFHLEYACKLAEKGISIFIEKPLSTNRILLEKLENIILRKQLTTMVGFQSRFNPCVKETKKILKKKQFGKIIYGAFKWCTYLPEHHQYEDYRKGYAARKDLGGGVIFSLSHELDLIQYYFGIPISVFALEGGKSNLEMNVEDTIMALFSCYDKEKKFPVSLHLSFSQGLEKRKFEILMEKGLLECDLLKNRLTVSDQNKKIIFKREFKEQKRNDMFLAEMKNFLESFVNGDETLIPVSEGKKSLIMALGIHESLITGNIIKLH